MDKEFRPSEQEIQASFELNANGLAPYTGSNDPALDFGSASSFANENSSKRSFVVDVRNTGTADVVVALCAAHYADVDALNAEQNVKVDYILKDGVQDALTEQGKTLNCVGMSAKISQFAAYIKECPTRIHTMIVKVSEEGMLDNPFQHKRITPFDGGENFKTITPANWVNEDTQNNKMATVDCQAEELQFSSQRLVLITIPAKQTMKLTLLVGATANRDIELEKAAELGRVNISRMIEA